MDINDCDQMRMKQNRSEQCLTMLTNVNETEQGWMIVMENVQMFQSHLCRMFWLINILDAFQSSILKMLSWAWAVS